MDKKLTEYLQGLMPAPTDIPETIEDSYIMSEATFNAIAKAQAELGPEPDVRSLPGTTGPNPAWVKWYCIKNLVEEWEAIHAGNMRIDFDGDPDYITLDLKPRNPELCYKPMPETPPDFHPEPGSNKPNAAWVQWYVTKSGCTEDKAIAKGRMLLGIIIPEETLEHLTTLDEEPDITPGPGELGPTAVWLEWYMRKHNVDINTALNKGDRILDNRAFTKMADEMTVIEVKVVDGGKFVPTLGPNKHKPK